MTPRILTGQTDEHIQEYEGGNYRLLPETAAAFESMKTAALKENIELCIVSSFRGFDHQLSIWNRKFKGELPLIDMQEKPISPFLLDEKEKTDAILYWSALPGGSRHHWGTDIDVIDKKAIQKDSNYQLIPSESAPGGVFQRLHQWLRENSARFGFCFPYQGLNEFMYLEPWHISYKPIADQYLQKLTLEIIEHVVFESAILGKNQILASLERIYQTKILNVAC